MPLTRDEDIAELLIGARTIAMVGASDRPDRPSYGVMKFLQSHNYRVLPVNPQITASMSTASRVARLCQIGEPLTSSLSSAAGPPREKGRERHRGKAVWLQLGIVNDEAAKRAEAAGLKVVMDRCIKIEILRLRIPKVETAEA